jgi:hypothetical protein
MYINYVLYDAGWAEGWVAASDCSVRMNVSYLHNSLQQLGNAVLQLHQGAKSASVVFMDEPGEHHLLFESKGGEQIAVELRWYTDWASWGMHSPGDYQVRLETTCTLAELTVQVFEILRTIHETFGPEGYRKKWIEHDFPLPEFRQLQQIARC